MENTDIFICQCHSHEHQIQFWYDEEENEFYTITHLCNSRGFFSRVKHAFKYIFGYTSRFGDWDELQFKPEDAEKLKKFLNETNVKPRKG
jgi:uncharacterized Fe-S cluster-containing radical SAM superfamily protein